MGTGWWRWGAWNWGGNRGCFVPRLSWRGRILSCPPESEATRLVAVTPAVPTADAVSCCGRQNPAEPPPRAGCRSRAASPIPGGDARGVPAPVRVHAVMLRAPLGPLIPAGAAQRLPPRPHTSGRPGAGSPPSERGRAWVAGGRVRVAMSGGGFHVEVCVAMGLPSQGVSMAAARCCWALPEVLSPPGCPSTRVHREGAATAAAATAPRHLGALQPLLPLPPPQHPPPPPPRASQSPFPRLVFSSLHFSG